MFLVLNYTAYSSCVVDNGSLCTNSVAYGTQTRHVSCYNFYTNEIVDLEFCDAPIDLSINCPQNCSNHIFAHQMFLQIYSFNPNKQIKWKFKFNLREFQENQPIIRENH